jgi:hypothetical protein
LPAIRLPSLARAINLMPVIHDVDEALRALVKRDALNGSQVEVAFDAPTKDWVARRNAPTVDMYLYDIREDTTRRETAWIEVRDEKGIVTDRRLPPRRFRLSYLVTAWTNRPEDEHRLLSALLSCFIRHEFMPGELLVGELEGQTLPVLMNVALPVPADRNIADVWSAMGGELKPSLDLIVTAPLDLKRSLEAGPPVREQPFLDMVRLEPKAKRPERTTSWAAGEAIEGNGAAAGGKATPAKGKAGRGGKGGTVSETSEISEAAAAADGGAIEGKIDELPDETFFASLPGAPGRRIRVRALPRPRKQGQ